MERQLQPVIERPFVGLNEDTNAPHQPGEVLVAENVFLVNGRYRGRPGLVQVGAALPGQVQGIFSWDGIDGTRYTVAFANGDMYKLDDVAETWTQVDLSALAVTISAGAQVQCTHLRGKLLFTDGVNKPVEWDPDTDTFTVLLQAPIASDVEIYYAKAFFSGKPDQLLEFEWSQEADAQLGYAGVNNVWTFGQRDQGPITKLMGGNEALLVFKQDSISLVRGAANDSFVSSGTREGVSESEGALGHRCVVWGGRDVFFLSQTGLRMIPGGFSEPVKLDVVEVEGKEYHLLSETWPLVNRAYWQNSIAAWDPRHEHILFAVPTTGADLDTIIVYSQPTKSLSVFKGWSPTAMATVEYSSGEEYVLIGDASGKVYRYGSATYSDNGVAIDHRLESKEHWSELGAVRKRMAKVEFVFNLTTDITTLEVTPKVDGVARKTRGVSWHGNRGNTRYTRGLNEVGYGLRWVIRHNEVDEQFELVEAVTVGTLADAVPGGGY